MTVRDRYRLLCNKSGSDWWSIVFGYPVGRAVLAFCADWKWLSPDGMTWGGFAVKVASAFAVAVADTLPRRLLAVVLLQAGTISDAMDGTLARYRGRTSWAGAYIDRVTDAVSLFLILTGLSWLVFSRTGEALTLFPGPVAGAAYLTICYIYWLWAYAVKETRSSEQPAAPPPAGWRGWLKTQIKIFYFREADVYFWVGLFLLVGRPEWALATMGILLPGKAVYRFVQRLRMIRAAERAAQGSKE